MVCRESLASSPDRLRRPHRGTFGWPRMEKPAEMVRTVLVIYGAGRKEQVQPRRSESAMESARNRLEVARKLPRLLARHLPPDHAPPGIDQRAPVKFGRPSEPRQPFRD